MEVVYIRKYISCLNKVRIVVTLPNNHSEALCPLCKAIVCIWP